MPNKLKFKPNRIYNAKYTFPTSFTAAGDVINSTCLSTNFKGSDILKNGLKNTIRSYAEKLEIPKGYSCDVDEDDD